MQLNGSCHCGAVKFTVRSNAPCPYMKCYCSVCRKTAGGGGYVINLSGIADTLEVDGSDNLSVYQAMIDGAESPAQRNFCSKCGSALWLFDPRWPELLHPFASAIDTPFPRLRRVCTSCSRHVRNGPYRTYATATWSSMSTQRNPLKTGTDAMGCGKATTSKT